MIQAAPCHAAACAAIHVDAFPPGQAWSAASLAALLAAPGVHGLIDPAGSLLLMRHAGDEAEILTLATVAALRRRGAARRLLRAGLTWAAAQGVTQIFLEVSRANEPARALYGAAGFVACGLRPNYYADGGDALVLRLSLGE